MIAKVIDRFTRKSKPSRGKADDGVDLDNNKIVLDLSKPKEKVATRQVLKTGTKYEEKNTFKNDAGKVYVLDLRPFFKVMKTKPGSRMAQSFIDYCDNRFAQLIGSEGAYTCRKDRQFLFQLSTTGEAGWLEAVDIINDIGVHYLRDAYDPELMVKAALAMMNPEEANKIDSRVESNREIDNQPIVVHDVELENEDKHWSPIEREKIKKDMQWETQVVPSSYQARKEKRAQQRRQADATNYNGIERRFKSSGRREMDNPGREVW